MESGLIEHRYQRQSFLGATAQDDIAEYIVGIVGLGGGGSHIVQQLAHLGFQRYRIFDHDYVSTSNLNRLIGAALADAEQKTPKILVAERIIRGLQPSADIAAFSSRWQDEPATLRECQIIFGCVDTYAGRDELEAFCRRYLMSYIDIGMDIVKGADAIPVIGGQVILSIPGSPCMRCMNFLTPERLNAEAALYGETGGRPQVVWSNGILASAAVGTAIELLTNWCASELPCLYLQYDGNRRTMKPHFIASSLNAKSCLHYPADAVGKPVFQNI